MAAFKSIKRLKADARASLLGNLITPVISVLLYLATTAVLTELIANFRTGSVLLSLLLSVIVFLVVNICAKMLRIGLCCIFLRLQLRKGARISDLFYGFRNSSDTAVKISTHLALLELLCMMPLFIALSVLSAKGISGHRGVLLFLFAAGSCASFFFRIYYALIPYLFLDFPRLSARSLLSGGAKMIRGHRIRLFRLYLSFLPLHILTIISMGVAGLWVSCYSQAAEAAFYRDLIMKIRAKDKR